MNHPAKDSEERIGAYLKSERVLVRAPVGRDAELACRLFSSEGLSCEPCISAAELGQKAQEGAGAVLMTEEALTSDGARVLTEMLHNQPDWSDLPVIILISEGHGKNIVKQIIELFGSGRSITILDRPTGAPVLLTMIRSALESRKRQYLLRDLLKKLQVSSTKLVQSNQDLQDFAFVASHDLKEPLRKVMAFGEALQKKYARVLEEEGRDYLQRMTGAASRMSALIESLLEYARVATRAQPFTAVDLGVLVREVLSDLEVRIEKSGATVEVSPLPVVEADPQQIRQLFQNLIENGLKFNREQRPTVRICASTASGGRSRIFVQDNGIGFDQKHADRIFVPFERLHGRSDFEGTGIGLAICKRIAERHGGSITVKSTPGKGSTFIVELPVKQAAGEPESDGQGERPGGG